MQKENDRTGIPVTVFSEAGASGAAGGKAGYNEVSWDAKSDSGEFIGNGMYLYFVVAGSNVIGKGKMVTLY